jgi:hypothetical protein
MGFSSAVFITPPKVCGKVAEISSKIYPLFFGKSSAKVAGFNQIFKYSSESLGVLIEEEDHSGKPAKDLLGKDLLDSIEREDEATSILTRMKSLKNLEKPNYCEIPEGGWTCSSCENYNFPGRMHCNRCKKLKSK